MVSSSPVSASSREPDGRPLGRQQLVELGGDPLAGQMGNERGLFAGSRPASSGSIAEPEGRREADGPDHPERVLLEPGRRVADGPQDPAGDVGSAAERIDERGACGDPRRRRPASRPTPSR